MSRNHIRAPDAMPDEPRRGASEPDPPTGRALRTVGLFAGIAGLELGLHEAGHSTVALCDADPFAQVVLREGLGAGEGGLTLHDDVRTLSALPPEAQLVAAGFPCQDLSQAGRTAGIDGERSGLVDHVFRLLADRSEDPPRWLLLENVPFMLQLDGGRAMHRLTEGLSELGYSWAYRVVDTRAFGLPQRRRRVLLLASCTEDPRPVLLGEDAGPPAPPEFVTSSCGFYWTEGTRGLGLAVDAVPTLKSGSSVGIASPPAIWVPGGGLWTPDVRDAERLQGFDTDWTLPADGLGGRRGVRWRLVGNAVSVPVARWMGERLGGPVEDYDDADDRLLFPTARWPDAGWGDREGRRASTASAWPRREETPPLLDFLEHPLRPLSVRATAGFLRRVEAGNLRFPAGFVADVREHLRTAESTPEALSLVA